MKVFKAFIKPFEAPQIGVKKKKKIKLIFYLRPGSGRERLSENLTSASVISKSRKRCNNFEAT